MFKKVFWKEKQNNILTSFQRHIFEETRSRYKNLSYFSCDFDQPYSKVFICLAKYLKYLTKLKSIYLNGGKDVWTCKTFAALYSYMRARKEHSLNVIIRRAHTSQFVSTVENDLLTAGYLLSLIAASVMDRFVAYTDNNTNTLFMKFFFTSIDLQTRRRIFDKPFLLVGPWYNEPSDVYQKYDSLSDSINLGKYGQIEVSTFLTIN